MIAIVLSVVFLVITMLAFWVSKHGAEPCVLKFRIATYGSSSYISEIEINEEGWLVAMTHNDAIRKHSPYPLRSEGAVEYFVSVRFGVWAEKELGEKYCFRNKGWRTFSCPVTKNGRQLTYNEYLKETSPETRSRKNPTLRIWYEESGPPNNTSIKHTECVKL